MKILIIKYLPSGNSSNTLKLVNFLKQNVKPIHQLEEVDLIKTPPVFFDEPIMAAYKKRNFGGEQLDAAAANVIQPMDKLTEQFVNSDVIVLATPMHNFSLPGLVKLYFDSIMQNGVAFKYENGKQIGLMDKKRFVTIYTSMGSYTNEYSYMDNVKTIVKIELGYMGVKQYEFIHASTGNPATRGAQIEEATKALQGLISNWQL